ncbi:MAG: hypothetical protein ACOCX4_07425 [Planctomycetota bacterium]
MMRYSRTCGIAWVLCAVLVNGAAWSGDAGKQTSADLARKIRGHESLTLEESQYVDRIARARGWNRNQVADHLERVWKESERLEQDRSNGVGHSAGPVSEQDAPASGGRGPAFGLILAAGVALLIGERIFAWARKRLGEHRRLQRVRRAAGATDLALGLGAGRPPPTEPHPQDSSSAASPTPESGVAPPSESVEPR